MDDQGKPKTYNVSFKSKMTGHLSDQLKKDINSGKIQSIELITERDWKTKFDESGFLVEEYKSIHLSIGKSGDSIVNKAQRISSILKGSAEDYDRARISFKTESGVPKSVDFELDDGVPDNYVKKEKIDGFDYDLLSSYEKINSDIANKMEDLAD